MKIMRVQESRPKFGLKYLSHHKLTQRCAQLLLPSPHSLQVHNPIHPLSSTSISFSHTEQRKEKVIPSPSVSFHLNQWTSLFFSARITCKQYTLPQTLILPCMPYQLSSHLLPPPLCSLPNLSLLLFMAPLPWLSLDGLNACVSARHAWTQPSAHMGRRH